LVSTAPKERIGPYGGDDPDGDGITGEISEGQVTALTLYVAMQELPQIEAPTDPSLVLTWADGRERFATLGRATCHVPSLPLSGTTFTLPSRVGGAGVSVDLAKEGAEPRIIASAEDNQIRAFLFSDLKRHDLGPALAEARTDRGVAGNLFVTR